LTAVSLDGNVHAIDDAAFMGATQLAHINLPDHLTTIKSSAFQNCTSLKEIALPASVSSIGALAFRGCEGLSRVSFDGAAAIAPDAFSNVPSLSQLEGRMGLFTSAKLGSLTHNMLGDVALTIPDYSDSRVSGLDPSLFGDKTVHVNGVPMQWASWIAAYRQPAAPATPAAQEPAPKKSLFGRLFS
jgi:hypothetical protein